MPIKHLFGRGIGFNPNTISYIPTKGYGRAEALDHSHQQTYIGGGGQDGTMVDHVQVSGWLLPFLVKFMDVLRGG